MARESSKGYEVRMREVKSGFTITVRGADDPAPTSYLLHEDGRWTRRVAPGEATTITDLTTQGLLDGLRTGFRAITEVQ